MIKLNLGLLKIARRNRNLTTEQAGKLLGRDRTTIWRWETGLTDIPTTILCQMMDLYKVTPMNIFVQVQED